MSTCPSLWGDYPFSDLPKSANASRPTHEMGQDSVMRLNRRE